MSDFVDKIMFTSEDMERANKMVRFMNKARMDMMPTMIEVKDCYETMQWFNMLHMKIGKNLRQQKEAAEMELKVIEKEEQDLTQQDSTGESDSKAESKKKGK